MRMKKIYATCAVFMMVAALIGCGDDEYSTAQSTVVEEEAKVNSEKARTETEEEIANRAKQQVEIAKAKAEAQKQYQSYELVMNGNVGEVLVKSSYRADQSVPAYIYFPKDFVPERTYPLVIMYSGFSSTHDNGTRFDDITREMTENGLMVVQYDAPGYGKSEETNLAYTLTNIKNDSIDVLNYVINTFNIGQVGALGYDVGGRAVMEIQVDKRFDFDRIELIAPYCEASEFIHGCFGEDNWGKLKLEATDNGKAQYVEQEYSLQWFLDWEDHGDNLTDEFAKAYKGKSCMVIYSTDDTWVKLKTMENLYNKTGAAAIYVTDGGHDLGVRNYESPKNVSDTVRISSVDFMKGLIEQ